MSDPLDEFNELIEAVAGVADGPVRLPPVERPPTYLLDEEGAPVGSEAPELVDWMGTRQKEQVVGEVVDGRTIYVPEMTTEELEEGVAPKGKYLRRVEIPDGVSVDMFKTSLAAAYMQFLLEGTVDVGGIIQRTGRAEAATRKLLAAPEFQEAMKARGILVAGTSGLTAEQDYALQIILDPYDGLPMRRKLEKAKVSNSKYQAWLKNPLFKAHVTRMSEQIINSSDVALVQLASKVGDGDMKAIIYQLELNGRYNPANQQTLNVMVILQQVMEIMARNIKDQSILEAVAGELRSIAENVQKDTKNVPRLGG